MSKKILLWHRSDIAGRTKDFRQQIDIYYYPEEGEKCDKIAVFFRWFDRESGEHKAKQSTYFSSFEQLKAFLRGVGKAVGKLGKKRDKFTEIGHKIQTGNIANGVLEEIREVLKEDES